MCKGRLHLKISKILLFSRIDMQRAMITKIGQLDVSMELCKIDVCPSSTCPSLYSVSNGAIYTVSERIYVGIHTNSSTVSNRIRFLYSFFTVLKSMYDVIVHRQGGRLRHFLLRHGRLFTRTEAKSKRFRRFFVF